VSLFGRTCRLPPGRPRPPGPRIYRRV